VKEEALTNLPGSLIGKFLGKYKILERTGSGGMAEVYRGRHEQLNREVAIKVLHPALIGQPEFLARFEREARLVANLRHPNIVQMFDFDTQNDQVFMVMEFIPGGTLKQRLEELRSVGQFMPLPEVISLLKQMASALDYAHSQKMLHRDLKPSNILLDGEGNLFLTDFGIAHMLGGVKLTTTGSLLGTPAYMSPEQGLGEPLTPSSDLYSLAIILYEMITGKIPFDADTPLALLQKQINDNPPSLDFYRKGLPTGLNTILQKALSKKAEDRYKSAANLFDAVETVMQSVDPVKITSGEKTGNVRRAGNPSPSTRQAFFSNKWNLFAIILLIALIIGAGALWITRQSTAALIRRCSTPEGCQLIAHKLMESNRYPLAEEALAKAIMLVPQNQQPTWAHLKCDLGDASASLGKKVEARGAYRDCIAWTHNLEQFQSIRDYAQNKIKDLK
jgi:serine/threonine protein kinase